MSDNNIFFKTLHEGVIPAGYLGQSSHYSILRAPAYLDRERNIEDVASFQDFAIVWNKDNYPNVIKVAVNLFEESLLYPVLFIGEQRGKFAIIFDKRFANEYNINLGTNVRPQIKKMIKSIDRSWTYIAALLDKSSRQKGRDMLIEYEFDWSFEYLKGLKICQNLGIKHKNQQGQITAA